MPVIQFDRNRSFRVWDVAQIWKGTGVVSTGTIVPNPRDIVIDPGVGLFLVLSVDSEITLENPEPSYLSVLQLLLPWVQQDGQTTHQSSVLDRAYLNTKVRPYTITIDPTYTVAGSDAAYMKLFRGTDTSALSGEVISAVYSGLSITSENIMLERVNPNNDAEKRPVMCNCTQAMNDKELITGVIYNHQGGVIGERLFLVRLSNAMRGLGQTTDYIVDVVLLSSMLDPNILDTINVPASVPIAGGDFRAQLIYNSGAVSEIAVGTNKCKIHGLDHFNTSLSGVVGKVVLTYYPDETEAVINTTNPAINNLSHMYNIRTINNVLDASYKIYVVPKYNAAQHKYNHNEYYLTDLQYGTFIKLTGAGLTVRPIGQTPLDYAEGGLAQMFILSCRVAQYLPGVPGEYRFTQAFTLQYGEPGSFPWVLDYLNDNVNPLGVNTFVEFSDANIISLRSGTSTLPSWLARVWYPLYAIYDDTIQDFAPVPTHYKLMYETEIGGVREISSTWNNNLPNDFSIPFVHHSTISIIWLKATATVDEYLTLGVTPMRLQNTL